MRNALYITSFNSPELCEKLMEELETIDTLGYQKILSDQSDGDYVLQYQKLCEKFKYQYVHSPNFGAKVAKHNIIRHAAKHHFSFMAQISEDFCLCPNEELVTIVPCGKDVFFSEAHRLLISKPNITFVNWTFYRKFNENNNVSLGYMWGQEKPMWRLRNDSGKLLHIDGDICIFNWPYSARVSSLHELLQQADYIQPNSEEALAKTSLGHGVCLLAQPVLHQKRTKHTNSIQ